MTKKSTLVEFIEKAVVIHGDRYNYANVDYINAKTKVNIECQIHGTFQQTPNAHLSGYGCKQCAGDKRKQTNLSRHGIDNLFKTVGFYTATKEKRIISNLARYGVDNPRKSESVKNKIKQRWLENYGVDNPKKVPEIVDKGKITCLERYGEDHYLKTEVGSCKLRTTLSQINLHKNHSKRHHLTDILEMINNPEWLFDQYITQNKTSIQIAEELKIVSYVTILRYLHKHEIAIKQSYNQSFKAIQWLESIIEQENINIQHALNEGEYQIPGTKYKADGYCAETNTIYEFYGDYWHGNPKVYSADSINEVNGLNMSELYQQTIKREQELHKLGYNLITIWEYDYEKTK